MEYAQSHLRDPDKNVQVLTSIRNSIDQLLTLKEREGQKEYYLKENLKAIILEQAPADARDVYKKILETIEANLRGVRNTLIGKFIHLDTGKLLKTPLRADVEHVFMEATSLIRYLSQLIGRTHPI